MFNSNFALNYRVEINLENVKFLLKQLSSHDNIIRTKAEEILTGMKYSIQLYQILFFIFTNESDKTQLKVQSIIIIKNLLRNEINTNISKFRICGNSIENGI
jgi:hypothetical protein